MKTVSNSSPNTTGNADFFSAEGIMSLVGFMSPNNKRTRIYSAGDLLNDNSAGSASDVQKTARAQFTNKMVSRTAAQDENAARKLAQQSGDAPVAHESRQIASFMIPSTFRA